MYGYTSWAAELAAINDNASFEIGDVTPAKVPLDSDELYGSGLPRIVGNSDALRRVLDMVRVVAPTDATVLIQGETGTGKELIAEAIHKYSDRSNGPFVKVNCAAIPAGLLESELFGHERGAYTGAVARATGRFERAHRGTLFLDEIGDLPLELQPKLLRVIQERQFERLGGAATIHTDVRVICATHQDLVEMVDKREFRADLFYRLSVFPVDLPPLRERPEDPFVSPPFCNGLRCSNTQANHEHFRDIHDGSDTSFMAGQHPGIAKLHRAFGNSLDQCRAEWFAARSHVHNTRRLKGTEAAVLSGSLPEVTYTTHDGSKGPKLSVTLKEAERSHILETLQQTRGVVGGPNGAAGRLGMPRTTLIAKMRRLGISSFQSPSAPSRATRSAA